MPTPDFANTISALATIKAEVAAQATKVASAASAVAALAATKVGDETDAAREARLRTTIVAALQSLRCETSRLDGLLSDCRTRIDNELSEVKRWVGAGVMA